MANNKLKISVIIPTYNRAVLLRNCIEALLHQTLDQNLYEIIIVDNNSIDETKTVVEHHAASSQCNVRYIIETKPGLHYARHAGAKAAHSDILAYTDDDAICDEHWLDEVLRGFNDEDVGCVGGKILVKWDREPPTWIIPYEAVLGRLDHGRTSRILTHDEYINGGNFSIRRDILYKLGGFNPDQVGEILLGDGEVGLCKKIHESGIKMAWVPDAIVWHLQTVNKNATLSDMKRRFANNGIASAYDSYKAGRRGRLQLFVASLMSLLYAIKLKLLAFSKEVRGVSDNYQDELESAYYLKKSLYELKLIYKKSVRELTAKENWLE